MKKYLLGAFCLLLSQIMCFAEEHTSHHIKPSDANVIGHVIDAKTGEHIAYATIVVEGTTIGVTTDATGHYFLKNLPEGTCTLSVSMLGYKTEKRSIEIVKNKVLEANFKLTTDLLSLEEVVVTASRTETNRKTAPTIVAIASTKQFESTASNNLAETMNFQSGLRVENNCGNCGTTQLRINGLEGQYSQILIDSRPIFSSLAAVYGLEQLPRGHDRSRRGYSWRRVSIVWCKCYRRCCQYHH